MEAQSRTVVSCAVLAALLGCGSAGTAALEIGRLDPQTIGARIPDFILTISGTGFAPEIA